MATGLRIAAAAALVAAFLAAPPATAASPERSKAENASVLDDYEPTRAGHPIRIIAYMLHPVGVAADYLVMRPLYWLGSFEPLRTIFGRTD